MLLSEQAFAQAKPKKSRILFLVDASSSMSLNWNPSNTRFDVASNIILHIVDSIYSLNNEVEFAVRAYGTLHPAQEKNCYDTELEVPFNIQNSAQIKVRMKYIKPIGFSPIAYSLAQASSNELNNSANYDYSIIFLTDGGESCGGDVCNTYRDFVQSKIKVKPYVIGLDKNPQLKSFYECMGKYVEVTEAADIPKAISLIVDENRPLLDKPKQLNLKTELSKPPVIKDSPKVVVKKVEEPKPIISKTVFPVLRITQYPVVKPRGILLNGAFVIVKKGNPVVINFDIEAPKKIEPTPPKPIVEREVKLLKPLEWTKSKLEKNKKVSLQGAIARAPEDGKAVIKFDVDAPVKPAPAKDLVVIPKLKYFSPIVLSNTKLSPITASLYKAKKEKATINFDIDAPPPPKEMVMIPTLKYSFTSSIAKTKPTPITASPYKARKEKATINFEVETPRQNVMIPQLRFEPKATTLPIAKSKLNGKTVVAKRNEAKITFEVEAPRQNIIIPGMRFKSKELAATPKPTVKAKTYPYKRNEAKVTFEVESRPKEVLTKIAIPSYPMRYSYAFRIPSQRSVRPPKTTAKIAFEIEAPKKRDTIRAQAPTLKPVANEMEYTVETANSEKTKVQVYFIGPNRKAYLKAKPEIEVYDATTNKLVTSFRREMSGIEPVPVDIQAGKYNIVVKGQSDLISSNVEITAGKMNKVFIKVTDGTLAFAYMGNLKRPVEFNAIVNRRFAAGATVLQKCSERLNYEPGTYYVEINTLPASKFSVDLTFGAVYELQIPEPGTLEITNTKPYGKIQLQSVLGDEYLTFKAMEITGNAEDQRLILQPGPYKAIVPVNPAIPQAGTKVIEFRVTSNKVTELLIE